MRVKSEWTQKVAWLAKATRAPMFAGKVHIHFQISIGSNRGWDPDNLNWAVTKPTLDGLKGIIMPDDTIDHVELSYSYDRTKPAGFQITVQELS